MQCCKVAKYIYGFMRVACGQVKDHVGEYEGGSGATSPG